MNLGNRVGELLHTSLGASVPPEHLSFCWTTSIVLIHSLCKTFRQHNSGRPCSREIRSLLHQVSWSIDVLFINILQNRTLSSSLQDVSLIEKVMKLFERIDEDYARHTSYRICSVFHKAALRAIHNS